MRLLILCTVMLLTGMQARAQRIRLSLSDAPFKELFTIVEQQTRFSFVYSSEQLQLLPRINVDDSIDLFSLLAEQLQHTQIGFTIKGNFIILVSKKNNHTVKGKVLDRSGKPVEGLTVQPLNGEGMSLTDLQGGFEIKNIAPDARLMISGAEIETSVIKVSGRHYIEIVVSELIRELEETVVPGYGSIRKRFNTGNIVKVNFAELPPSATGNLLTSLQARVPGLLITATGGAPSSSYVMQIRGQHSINPNPLINYRIPPVDQPLVIIDGVPFAPQNNNVNQLKSIAAPGNLELYQSPYGGISPFSLINAEMIESVEVLKDAVSTSVYGSRAANGILLINTRKPYKDKFSVETHISTGINIISGRPTMLSVEDYLRIRQAAFTTDGQQPSLTAGSTAYAPDLLKFSLDKQTDWSKYLYHSASPILNISSAAQQVVGKFSYLSNLTLRHEKYLLKGNFGAQQFSSNNQFKFVSINDRLHISTGIIYSRGWNYSPASPSLLGAISLPPNYPDLYDLNGNINWSEGGVDLNDNPAALLRQPYTIDVSNLLISSKINYRLTGFLTATINAGYNRFLARESAIYPTSSFASYNKANAQSVFAYNLLSTKIAEPQLEYKIAPGNFHFTALSGLTLQQNNMEMESQRGTRYLDESSMNSLQKAGKIDERSIREDYHYTSMFANIDARYAAKYLLHLSGRRESSSRFAKNSKNGNFASIGLGWIFSEEQFRQKRFQWLSFGKLRVSYGSSGNDNIGYYHYLTAWAQNQTYLSNPSATTIRDASLSWSATHKLEAGLELRLLNNRLSLDISAYRHRSSDQLISQLSLVPSNRTRYLSNFPAIVENSGYEIIARINPDAQAKIKWFTQLNVSIARNTLKEFLFLENSLYAGLYWIGQPLGTVQTIHYSGIDTSTGFYSFNKEQRFFANTTPTVYGGWENEFTLKGWSIDLLFEFRIQQGSNYLKQLANRYPGQQSNLPAVFIDQQEPGIVPMQRPALPLNPNATLSSLSLSVSDIAYSNASYVKVRSLTVGYRVKNKMINDMRIYLQAQNILTFTSFPLLDPEVQSLYSYPLSKSIVAGFTVRL